MSIDNPASRLVGILAQGLEISDDVPCRKAWEKILSVSPNNPSELFMLLGKVMQLPGEVAQLVSLHFPHHINTISLWKHPVDEAFLNQNLQSDWQTFRQHINAYCIPQLNLIADLLHTKIGGEVIDEKEISELLTKFSALLDEITTSTMSASLKLYLTGELTTLLQLLREYRIAGAEPILKHADSMFGHVVRNQEYRSFLTSEEIGKRLLDNLSAMANLLTVATGLPQLTVVIAGLLR